MFVWFVLPEGDDVGREVPAVPGTGHIVRFDRGGDAYVCSPPVWIAAADGYSKVTIALSPAFEHRFPEAAADGSDELEG